MKVAIIGAGFCGLTAAYFLSRKNHLVFVFEKEGKLGGLGGSFKKTDWEWSLEKYYHHFFASDKEILKLAKELNIEEKLFFIAPKSSVFIDGSVYRFDNPKSILLFPKLSFVDKLRIGAVSTFLKINPFWKPLENICANNFIQKTMGKNAYHLLWEPLLKNKFGSYYKQIPASWFWTRIKKRSMSLGYFEGGSQTLLEALASKIKKNSGKIFLNTEIKSLADLKQFGNFDRIVLTVPSQTFLKIVPQLPQNYKNKISKLKMIGCLNLVFSLKEKFLTDGTYWLNVSDTSFPFVAVVEHTNFINAEHYNKEHLVYVGGYYPPNHRYFKMGKEDIIKEFLPYLKKINPHYNFEFCSPRSPQGEAGIIHYSLFTNLYAQPVPTLNYSQLLLPSVKTPIPNLYWASLHHVYPEDRGINYAIKLGKKIADEIIRKG